MPTMENWAAPTYDRTLALGTADPGEQDRAPSTLSAEQTRLESAQQHLLATASRDLHAPLLLLQGYATMLAEVSQNSHLDAQQVASLVGRIAKGTFQLRQAVEETIEITMIEARALELLPRPVDLSKIVCAILQDLRQEILGRGLVLSMERTPKGPKVVGDPLRLRQALQHLIAHVIANLPSDRARITMRSWQDDGPLTTQGKPNGFAELTISDGGGEPLEPPPAASADPRHSATQLAIAKGIIELHGGRMWMEKGDGNEAQPAQSWHVVLPSARPALGSLVVRPSHQPPVQLHHKALNHLRTFAGQIKLGGLFNSRAPVAQPNRPSLR